MSKPEREWRFQQRAGAFVAMDQGDRRNCLEDRAIVGTNYLIVCDGIGGHANGDAAAELVSREIAARLSNAPGSGIDQITQDVNAMLRWQIPRAGTTCSFAYVEPGDGPMLSRLHFAHIGDSSLWILVRGFGVCISARITEGHSAWHAWRRAGIEQDAPNPRRGKNVLLRWCPGRDDDVDSQTWTITHGSMYDISDRLEIFIVGTTDGYSEAWIDDRGDVRERDMAQALWQLIDTPVGPREAAVRAELERATAITKDNGTLAIWRVQ